MALRSRFFASPPLSGRARRRIGSGAGFDSFVADYQVAPTCKVVGVDMTEEMLAKSRLTAERLRLGNLEFRDGLAEDLPIEDGWADVVTSNGVMNLCADKRASFSEIYRVLRRADDCNSPTLRTASPCPYRHINVRPRLSTNHSAVV